MQRRYVKKNHCTSLALFYLFYQMAYFKTKIEAKLAIAKLLGKPLATISELQRLEIDKSTYPLLKVVGMNLA